MYFTESTFETGSEIPDYDVISEASLLSNILISNEKLLKVIRALNLNKAHGWDGISVRMTQICDSSLLLPQKIIFESCTQQGSFPETWKRANVVPIHKKNTKISKKTIGLFLCFQYLERFLKNSFSIISTNTWMKMVYLTPISQAFALVILP